MKFMLPLLLAVPFYLSPDQYPTLFTAKAVESKVKVEAPPYLNISQLTLEQLISLYNSEPNDINDFLSAKGWRYNGVVAPERDADGIIRSYGQILWAFNYNEFQKTAEAWFIPAVYQDEIVIANYQCKKVYFEAIKKRAIDIGMKKLWSGISENGDLVSAYQGAKYTLRFIVGANEDYTIKISGGEGTLNRRLANADQTLKNY